MKKIKKFLPVEFYFVLIPAFLLFLFLFFYYRRLSISVFGIKDFMSVFSSSSLGEADIVLILVLIFSAIYQLLYTIISQIFPSKFINQTKIKARWKQILSIFLILSSILFVSYSLMLSTGFIFKISDPSKTIEFSKLFLSWDKTIFGTNPGIWLINHLTGTPMETILLWTYDNIFQVLSLLFIAAFFINRKAFRKFATAFFISWIIALPIWFFFPAVSPAPMFKFDRLNAAGLENSKIFNSFTYSNKLKNDLDIEENIHIINTTSANRILPTSTFPSMHAAWGVIMAYAAILIYPLLGIIFVPLAIINGIGSVYILEHYSVDIFLGVIIAIISIILTEAIFCFESKYFEDKFGLLSGFDYVSSIIKNFWHSENSSK